MSEPFTVNHITPRQLEILRAYAETGSQKIVADLCGCSVDNVRHTLANIRSRLGVESTIQAAMIVFGGRE